MSKRGILIVLLLMVLVVALVFVVLSGQSGSSSTTESTKSKEDKKVIRVVFEMSPAKVEYEYKGDKRIEKPVFAYDPPKDTIKGLEKAGFSVVQENNQKYDLTLTIEYHERMYGGWMVGTAVNELTFALQDKDGNIVLKEELWPIYDEIDSARYFFTEELPELIKGRLRAADEVSFLISQIKQGKSLGTPVEVRFVEANIKHLVRLWELKDARATKAFVSILRSCDQRQRWIAKFALLDLAYRPAEGTNDEVAFEMVNCIDSKDIVAYNFLHASELLEQHKDHIEKRSLRYMIVTYEPPAIELIIENVKCEYIMPRSGDWYGGGDIRQVDPRLVLEDLTEEKWNKYIKRFTDPSGWEWKQEWNEAAVSKLIQVITAEHKELGTGQKLSLCSFAIGVLGEIADKRAIEPLRTYLTHPKLSEKAKEAIEKIEKRGK